MCEILATQTQGTLSYSNTKKRKAAKFGIEYEAVQFGAEVHLDEVLKKINQLNCDDRVHGILVGMPTYPHIDSEKLAAAIVPNKDVDGLGPLNSYFVFSNQEHRGIAPATAVAAIHILEKRMSLRGKSVAVIGRGRTVGRPVAAMLINRDATVTICHSRSPKAALECVVRNSEIVIAATGIPGVAQNEWFRSGQTVIDCGIAFIDGKTCGDLNALEISSSGATVTPVPKGVGLVTNSMIFGNLLRAISLR
jgi:methylenetetrahydrofolate dehydrogenase (NADP+)/methenyltetrahydrofolate cyclohydrolase